MIKIIVFTFLLLFGFFINNRFRPQKTKEIIKNLIIFVGAPVLIIHSVLSQETIEFGFVALIIIFSVVANMVLSKMGNHIFKLKNKGSFLLLNSFSNAGFLGLPLCWIVFGSQGLYYGSLYVVIVGLIHYSLGIVVALREEKAGWTSAIKDTLRFPVFWIFLIILVIFNLRITPSPQIMNAFGIIGQIALFLIMLYVGLNLVKPDKIKEFYKETFYVGAFRFLISPLVIFLPMLFLKPDGAQILAFMAMMPPAIFNTVIASYYRLNERLCASITTILTILFLVGFVLFRLIAF